MTPLLAQFLRTGHITVAPPRHHPHTSLTVGEQCRVRDRSTILARQIFAAEKGVEFADQTVGRLLVSLQIDPGMLPADGDALQYQRVWDSSLGHTKIAGDHAMNAMHRFNQQQPVQQVEWATEFEGHETKDNQWAREFSATIRTGAVKQGGSTAWVNEFSGGQQEEQEQTQQQQQRQRADPVTTLEQTKRLADTLAANKDPKFQNSKFLQFVSKMSRGELILDDNEVKQVHAATAAATATASSWANEFQNTSSGNPSLWGEEFASFQANQHPHLHSATTTGSSAAAAVQNQNQNVEEEEWAEEFAQGLTSNWAQEFAGNAVEWEEEYLRELQRLHISPDGRGRGEYVMAENNPFLSDLDSLSKGKELFKRGVLSEAVLAFEAECQRHPSNSEAWRLLGTVHAENDDDVQAIAALNRAIAADPSNLEALLSLGVAHTNELDQQEALTYLREWILKHPVHGESARRIPGPPDSSQAMMYVLQMYEHASAGGQSTDPDVHAALGVLCNLARRYDEAVGAFKAALDLRPQDYSLWNKLGATLANSSRSGDALDAYKKALELKPNYMRAWTNMGISLANIGDYEGSARYYVRALTLNRRAVAVWGYLRTSLSCAAREDLMRAADAEDVETLLQALPL